MNKIKENNFEAPGVGSQNYAPTYGTPAGPNQTQDPDHFEKSDNNKAVNQNSNTDKKVPKSKQDRDQQLNAIYSKKDVPTPDEIVSGIKYEMGQQIKKNKGLAKETVLDNLKKDPHYYRDLKMLNINDKSMVDNMTESKHPNDPPAKLKVTPNVEETKKIFAEMAKGKDKKYVVNSALVDVMNEMWKAKKERNNWRGI